MTVIQNGGDAFREAFETYTDMVYRIALQNTRSGADAEDLTQEAFLRLYQSRKPFRDAEHIKAWLIRVTLNLCKNYWRDRRREPVELHPAQSESSDGAVLDAVRELPPNQRNAVYLHYYEGYTAAEIGKMLGAGTNTVLSWLRRGREALREKIGGIDNGEL
jgi:RNA polymerase sigma-70 factor (ECF subfamily)